MMATEFTEQTVLEFLTERGGTVRQLDLIDHFELICKNDDSNKKLNEEILLTLVDGVALVKLVDGVKFVCVKNECTGAGSLMRADTNGRDGECNGNGVHAAVESPLSGQGEQTETSERLCRKQTENQPPDTNGNSEIRGKELDNVALDNGNDHLCIEEEKESSLPQTPAVDFPSGEVKLRERRRRESAPTLGVEPDPGHSGGGMAGQVRGGRRVSRGSQRALLTSGLSEDSAWEGLDPGWAPGDGNTPKGSRRNFIELMMSSSPQVRRSMIHRGSRLRDSVRSDGGDSSSADEADGASVALEPLEHEWMLCAADGPWDRLLPLLCLEPGLVAKRDFVTGFTCLHWAAKRGDRELLGRLLAFARDNGVHADVNARSGAGYTPLHLAAMHGHTEVVRSLMSDWDADPDARDYSGRKAGQYLHTGPASPAGPRDGGAASPGADSDAENAESGGGASRWRLPRVLQSGLNPLRLLNPPAAEGAGQGGEGGGTGKGKGVYRKCSLSRINARLHRGRFRTQIIHSASFREAGEVERDDTPATSPLKARPLSNLFG